VRKNQKHKKMNKLKKHYILWIGLLLVSLMRSIPQTYAYMTDLEMSGHNNFVSSSLDVELTSFQSQTTPTTLTYPSGLDTARLFTVADKGLVPSTYDLSFQFDGGNINLCDGLVVTLNDISGVAYSGPLSGATVSASLLGNGADLHLYVAEISLDSSLANTYEGEHCAFSYVVTTWQDPYYQSGGWTDTEVLIDRVDVALVPPEVPTGLTILDHNGVDVGCGGVTDNRLITVDWDDSTAPDIDHYDYQNKTSVTIAKPVVSERTGSIADQDGLYKYRVRAVDTHGTSSAWTAWCEVTLDRSLIISSGDVIINEVMWMGSDVSTSDEWIELKNTSTHPIDLSGFVIVNAGTAGNSITLPTGAMMGVGGYYLISNYAESSASSALAVTPDFVSTGISLLNTGGQLTLRDSVGSSIDQTPLASWPAGTLSTEYHSMERTDVPGDGTVSINWYSCTDARCNDTTYWDIEGDNFGTPGGANY